MVTNCCPWQPFILWIITGNLMFETYFEVFHSLLVEMAYDHLRSITECPWLPIVAPSN